jgi:hypothetical protein
MLRFLAPIALLSVVAGCGPNNSNLPSSTSAQPSTFNVGSPAPAPPTPVDFPQGGGGLDGGGGSGNGVIGVRER